ncbi:inorganic phosphate transporter [Methyloprofundus sp.]|uniref:inorganic phosphate transporter n=1 Tax=Methyloprofundus sp. TaxID=2020875 RepID=UPI003D12A53B
MISNVIFLSYYFLMKGVFLLLLPDIKITIIKVPRESMDDTKLNSLEERGSNMRLDILKFAGALLFLVAVGLFISNTMGHVPNHTFLIVSAVIGGYMALNIGANDVANNVGPAVGSGAITLIGAICIAMVFESAGALIAGGEVVSTIKKGIIDPSLINDSDTFIWLMLAALLAAAIWLNIATFFNAPVSTTHSIVGGVLGAGIAAGGFGIANWAVFGKIAASWVISPVLGGLIAAIFLYLIKRTITYQEDKLLAARRILPLLIALMAWAFSTYLILKGLKKIWKVDFVMAGSIAFAIALTLYFAVRPLINKAAIALDNSKASVNTLFTIPLIFAACFLSFAHGANDVANAVGPLAAINDAITHGGIAKKAAIPLWVMLIGAIGLSLGLALYGAKLIRTVGSEITELDKMRAFCISMAAAITVIIASQLGLPVSSTHIAVGAIFGVGFLREYLKRSDAKRLDEIREHHDPEVTEAFLNTFNRADIATKSKMLKELKAKKGKTEFTKKERKSLNKVYKQQLVKRSHVYKIAVAWVVTVPTSALMAAFLYFTIRGILIP